MLEVWQMSLKVYELVTERMVAALASGTVPWQRPWSPSAGRPVSMSSSRPYRGANVFLLGLSAMEGGFCSPWWGTYRQISELGGQVRKGERSTLVVFWKRNELAVPRPSAASLADGDAGEAGERVTVPMLRYFRVFNAEQTDGLPSRFQAPADASKLLSGPQQVVEGYLAAGGPRLRHVTGNQAFYLGETDVITLPQPSQFATAEGYYATVFHECGHSTGHASRLARPGITAFDHFGSGRYAREELVAEMTSAMCRAETGTDASGLFDNSAAYIASWLRALRDDKRMVVTAASQAEKACELIVAPSRPADHDHAAVASPVARPRAVARRAAAPADLRDDVAVAETETVDL